MIEIDDANNDHGTGLDAIMFIVYDMTCGFRESVYATYDDAEAHRRTLEHSEAYLIETVESDEDLWHTINR